MTFELHPSLKKKSFIHDLKLSTVLMEDEKHFPWIILVPRKPNLLRMIDLDINDQIQLMHEMNLSQKIVWDHFKPTQLNIAAIGNKTPQLHIHVIGRFKSDPAWPETVWERPKTRLEISHKEELIKQLQAKFKE